MKRTLLICIFSFSLNSLFAQDGYLKLGGEIMSQSLQVDNWLFLNGYGSYEFMVSENFGIAGELGLHIATDDGAAGLLIFIGAAGRFYYPISTMSIFAGGNARYGYGGGDGYLSIGPEGGLRFDINGTTIIDLYLRFGLGSIAIAYEYWYGTEYDTYSGFFIGPGISLGF